jgi:ferric-dicitrate binding protein FerR (iron transport regulator)
MDIWESLLERFLRNECTVQERNLVRYAINDGLIDDTYKHILEAFLSEPDSPDYLGKLKQVPDGVWENILDHIRKMESGATSPTVHHNGQSAKLIRIGRNNQVRKWLWKAASIAVAVVVTFVVTWLLFQSRYQTEQSGAAIAMNIVSVPSGQTVNMTLADGTKIWLNAHTTFKFPSVFTGDRREVILDGEGYFDVTYNPDKRFIVQAGGFEMTALGTAFNVESYSQGEGFTVSLLEGSIEVASVADRSQIVVLQPNMLARVYDGGLVTEDITDFDHYRWREGLICFENVSFPELMAKFEKYYGIKIIIHNNRVNNFISSGKFRLIDGVDHALRVSQRYIPFRVERDDENNIIYIK